MKNFLHTLLLLPFTFFAQVANDNCSTATVLTVNSSTECTVTHEGTFNGSTLQTGIVNCTEEPTTDVWYEFTATNKYHYISLLTDSSFTSLGIAVYEGCSTTETPLNPIYCIDNKLALNCPELEIGTTYKIRVYSLSPESSTLDFSICVSTYPNVLSVSELEYTIDEIVSQVLLTSETASLIDNITFSTGESAGVNGIGYFNNDGGNFPFSQGLVLCTGSLNGIPGPNSNLLSGGNWFGDNQLTNYMSETVPSSGSNYHDASLVEFDFIPLIDSISFEFIFASEEYGIYQCSFSDAFAIFLTDITDGNEEAESINIATLPGTDIPVSCVTIRDNAYNSGCASANPEYFASYNLDGDNILPGVPVNFNGLTVPITAQATVIPGNTYHIKFVISDRADHILDSAIFINGEDFNLGTVGDNLTIIPPTGNTLQLYAQGETLADLNVTGVDIQWYADDTSTTTLPESTELVDGQTYYASQTIIELESTERLAVTVHLVTADNLAKCDQYSDGFETFNLETNNDIVYNNLNPLDYYSDYYLTHGDAIDETNQIENLYYTNTETYTQTLYVRLTENNDPSNYAIATFELHVIPTPEIVTPQDIIVYSSLADLTINNTEILNELNAEEFTISFYNTETSAYAASPLIQNPETYIAFNGETIWIRVEQNETGCFSVTSQNVYVTVPPPTGDMDQFFYAGETLSDLEVTGENIQWYETETSDTPLPMNTPLEDGVTYYASQTIDGTESIERLAITAHQILGIEDQTFKNLTYYPNPVSNILTLSNINEISNIEAYNVLGQKVIDKDFNTTEVQLDMSPLETGIYLIKVTSQEQQKIIRIQKQ
ncbi:choice-of-anchor L domain-containing protein [Flavobacterium alkalisoli]|uniref:choice-of-anchor L domain-containing protein n=1 Tax=Flavobacterium alkalisoli TaxID=2602769 RepID=UPI003A925AE6